VTQIPHFSQPFRFGGPQAAVVEQDSIDEIADCVLSVLACPLGFRVELPEFGSPDLAFQTQPVDTASVQALVETWEPRASTLFSQQPDALDELVARVQLNVSIRTEE
jgi:phage baseplate assembly protein W